MRDPAQRQQALTLVADGLRPATVARLLGIPQRTVAHWLDPVRAATYERRQAASTRCSTCPRCWAACAPPEGPYVLLLGHYLGDGHISPHGRGGWTLSIACTDAWPGVLAEVEAAQHAVLGRRPWRVQRAGCTEVKAPHRHLPSLFPQHGAGRKHERSVVLLPWQQALVDEHPGLLLRGLFHSDGWRGTNVAVHSRRGGVVRYQYSRYEFSNRSDDIRGICTAALDRLGIAWRPSGRWKVAVSRREAVAALDEHVGPKH